MFGELIDRLIAVVSPAAAVQRMAARQSLRQLSSYAAADRGRRNKDWRATNASADLAIIPDARTLIARSRQLVRDSWVAQSAVHCVSRNVVGRGITPVPAVREFNGKESPRTRAVNRRLEHLFWEWASDREKCDVEQRQTFWAKQSLCVEERVVAGEHFLVWSYQPRKGGVGLKFQSMEADQLYDVIQSYGPNQVRAGIEIDDVSAPAAYHFYTRNPNDYLPRSNWQPVRVPRERCLHYFRQERTRQVRGVSAFHAVMQDARDFYALQQSHLWRSRMESCIGGALKTTGAPPLSGGAGTFPPAPGDPGQTPSGMRTIDFVPGMFPILQPGEEIIFNTPQAAGGNYASFAEQILRGIAAGLDMSYEQLCRDFSRGSYSSQRQGLLEDRRAWGKEQELVTDTVVAPFYRLFVKCCFIQGLLDDLVAPAEFLAPGGAARFTAAEYVQDGHDWIDPLKEVKAYETAIALRIKTRREIITAAGGRMRNTFEQIAEEKKLSEDLKIPFPEDVAAVGTMLKGGVVPPGGGPAAQSPDAAAQAHGTSSVGVDGSSPDGDEPTFDDPTFGDDDGDLPAAAAPITVGGRVIAAPTDSFGPDDVFSPAVRETTAA